MSKLTKDQEDYLLILRGLDEKIDEKERSHLLRESAEIKCSVQEIKELYDILAEELPDNVNDNLYLSDFVKYSGY